MGPGPLAHGPMGPWAHGPMIIIAKNQHVEKVKSAPFFSFPEVFFNLAYINLSENKFCHTDFSRRICLYPLLGGDSLIKCDFSKNDSHPCFKHF